VTGWATAASVQSVVVTLETEDLDNDASTPETVVEDGEVYVTATSEAQFAGGQEITYILTATPSAGGSATWAISGTCQAEALC
jgi:hypothetical protein